MDLRDTYCRFVEIIDEAVVKKNIYAVPGSPWSYWITTAVGVGC